MSAASDSVVVVHSHQAGCDIVLNLWADGQENLFEFVTRLAAATMAAGFEIPVAVEEHEHIDFDNGNAQKFSTLRFMELGIERGTQWNKKEKAFVYL